MRLKTRLTVFFVGVALIVSLAVGIVIIRDMQIQIEVAISEKARSDLATALEIADYMRPGPWHIEHGELYKGRFRINDDNELVDKIGRLTDDTVTIFLNNTRVATNIIRDGNRVTGTQAADYVTQTVLAGGIYTGEAEVIGIKYQTSYAPIKNDAGQIIGMFYIGVSKNFADQLKHSFTAVAILSTRIALLFALAATCFISVDAWSTASVNRTSPRWTTPPPHKKETPP